MVSAIWMLRVGLLLELLGAALLASDVFSKQVRGFMEKTVKRSYSFLTAVVLGVYLLSVVLYLAASTFFNDLLSPIVIQLTTYSQFLRSSPLPDWYTSNLTIILIITFILMYIYPRVDRFTASIILKIERGDQSLTNEIMRYSTISFWYGFNVVVLFGMPIYIGIIAIVFYFIIPIIFPIGSFAFLLNVGFILEDNGHVSEGLRFLGFLLLAVGFCIQLTSTFI